MPIYTASFEKLQSFTPDGLDLIYKEDDTPYLQPVEIADWEEIKLLELLRKSRIELSLMPEICWYFQQAKKLALEADNNYYTKHYIEILGGYEFLKQCKEEYDQLRCLFPNSVDESYKWEPKEAEQIASIRIHLTSGKSIIINPKHDIKNYISQYAQEAIVRGMKELEQEMYRHPNQSIVDFIITLSELTDKNKSNKDKADTIPNKNRVKFAFSLYQFILNHNEMVSKYRLDRFGAGLMYWAGFYFPCASRIKPIETHTKEYADHFSNWVKSGRKYFIL